MTVRPFTNRTAAPDPGSEDGQALVELMAVVIICTIMGFGIYEAGVLFHNVNVLNNAVELGATHAAHGAPWPVVQDIIYEEGSNLMDGAFLEQKLPNAPGNESNIIVEIWNPKTDEPLVTEFEPNEEKFLPKKARIAPYMFWSQGYEIRVGTHLEIGIYVPFIRTFSLATEIVGSRTIQASNDSDRDGMFDQYEAEYGGWWSKEGFGLNDPGDTWFHPVHRDGVGVVDSDSTVNIDGDTETDYGGCDLTIVIVCSGSTDLCDHSSTEDEEAIIVFNPSHQNWVYKKVTTTDEGEVWTGAVQVRPGEMSIVSNDADGDSLYGGTGFEIDAFPDTPLNVPTGTDQGYKVFDDNGAICDRVGYFPDASDDLSSDWFETAEFDAGGLSDIEFKRKTIERKIPRDSGDNSEDFTGITSPVGSSGEPYRMELPFDFNNDGIEDKFDIDDQVGNRENLLKMNHVVGPKDWPDTVP